MKRNILLIICLSILTGCYCNKNTIYQISTIDALLKKKYDGFIPYNTLEKHGDFGIGTYDKIDGELVALNGKFYQVRASGEISLATNEQSIPFATVNFFNADSVIEVEKQHNFDNLKKLAEQHIENPNLIYAVKISGTFKDLKLRAPHAEKEKPYKHLKAIIKEQNIFTGKNIKGTLVGYYSPEFAKNILVPKFHFHFISDDEKLGGHVLDATIKKGTIELDQTTKLIVINDDEHHQSDKHKNINLKKLF